MFSTDFSNTNTVVAPANNRQKVVYPQQPSRPNPALQALGNGVDGVGKGVGGVAKGAGQGLGWFFGELLRPVEALRTGMIDTFGVKEPAQKARR